MITNTSYEVQQNLIFQIADWSVDDVIKWLIEVELSDLVKSVQALSLNGRSLLRLPEEVIIGKLQFDEYDQEVCNFLILF